jgi:hypothetical protein
LVMGQSMWLLPKKTKRKKERKKHFDHTHQLIDKKHEIHTWVLFPRGKANKMTLVKTMSSLSLIKLCQKRQSSPETKFSTSPSTTFYSAYSIKWGNLFMKEGRLFVCLSRWDLSNHRSSCSALGIVRKSLMIKLVSLCLCLDL